MVDIKKKALVVVMVIGLIAIVKTVSADQEARSRQGLSEATPARESPRASSRPRSTSNTQGSVVATEAPTASGYKDGIYAATGRYETPEETEAIGVRLTLANGLVTVAEVTSLARTPESKEYQGMFTSGYRPYVVGKSISDLKLTRVAGSSLTPKGFNAAVEQIRAQAKA